MNDPAPSKARRAFAAIFCFLLGIFHGLSLCKFGNPIILDRLVETPVGLAGWITGSWPVKLGFVMVAVLSITALVQGSLTLKSKRNGWLLLLGWLAWTLLSCVQSVAPELSQVTVIHFSLTVLCFFTGLFWMSRQSRPDLLVCGIGVGFAFMISAGWDQHFGGLDATRKYFEIYLKPTMKDISPDFLAKMQTNRIFGTLFYPNSFAGAILLLLPPLGYVIWNLGLRFQVPVRVVLMGLVMGPSLLCLYWSGSKAGWLIALGMLVAAAIHLRISPKTKRMLLAVVMVAGLSGFLVKNLKFFQKGATSVAARSIYWKAALRIATEHPVLGTGPGTFSKPYAAIKPPGAEMARLVHNDYLEQACDSGWLAFLLYGGFVILGLHRCYRNVCMSPFSLEGFFLLGLAGWLVHGAVDFHLYIPALAWPAFLIFGYLWGKESTRIKSNFKVQAK